MDKNTITGIVLIGAVLVGFNLWSRPSKEELAERERQAAAQKAQQAQADSLKKQNAADQKAPAIELSKIFAANAQGKAKKLTLKNDKVEVTLNTKGGGVEAATIKGYKEYGTQQDVRLINKDSSQMEFTLAAKNENIYLSHLYFTPSAQTDNSVTLKAEAGNGGTLSISYTLRPESYVLDMVIQADGLENEFNPGDNNLGIYWKNTMRQTEKGFDFENRYTTLTYKEKEGDTESLNAVNKDREDPEEKLDWVAFKSQFFSAVLIGQQDFKNAQLYSEQQASGSGYLKKYIAKMQTGFDPTGKQPTQLQFYLGPNDYHILKDVDSQSLGKKDLDIEELVDLGWPIVRWINRFFTIYLFDWLRALGLPMGIVLLLLTLIVKALVFPATRKSYLSSARMRVLKPEVDKINAKYPNKEDALKKQQEMMQLYSSYGVSPMGGCLPMLLQMPIWIALFYFVPNAIELRGQSFLWAEDLSAYDSLISWNTDLPLIGNHISIFCVLFSATNIINTMISMRQQQNGMMTAEQQAQMKMMRWMMFLMPVFFFFMFNNYSSGLCYYYFLSGLTSVLIMWGLRRFTDDNKLLAQLKAYKEKNANNPKKMGGLAARLEAMQKMAEEQQRRQQQKKK